MAKKKEVELLPVAVLDLSHILSSSIPLGRKRRKILEEIGFGKLKRKAITKERAEIRKAERIKNLKKKGGK